MVKVSIGVPVYNVDKYLDECLDSIMKQTFKDFEVILVDDGSTDDSFKICQKYVMKDKRFKLIHQENKGLAGARNTCLKYMTGDFVTWIDSDDKVVPNYLERLLEVQKETQADIVNGVYYSIVENKIIYYDFRSILPQLYVTSISEEDTLESFFNNKYQLAMLWGNLERRKLYKGVYFSQGIIHEDTGNRFKVFLQAKKIVVLPEAIYGYRKRQDSIMSKKRESLEDKLDLVRNNIFNLEKFMFYMEIYKAKDLFRYKNLYTMSLDYYASNNAELDEMGKIKFKTYIKNYQKKLERIWRD
ncbi:glycosyltransferase [Lactobacillus salivarius]|uniref:Glycosyltransferase n=1 Tax=Ligilactobacillus salivarius TaxID=1624 RepID=A0A6A8LQD4_9LACO|nr:glycosyltransferase [Ligilactobacillus salivarius]MSE07035.1 glycosyltransferase [Ligilactobacillus salivarius]MSE07950.1 glycosyltransferase [Ligilactobacillus salivarius]